MSIKRADDADGSKIDWPRVLERVDFLDADLQGTRISGGLTSRARLRDCMFTRVRLDPFHARKLDVIGCKFDQVDFAGTSFGEMKDVSVSDSSFTRCDLSHLTFQRGRMENVFIEESQTSRLRLMHSELRSVTIRGRVDRLFLIDSKIDGLDLSAADLASLSIVNSELRGVLFPRRSDGFAVSGLALARSEPTMTESLSPEGRRKYATYAEMAAGEPIKPFVFGREILGDFSGDDRETIVEGLFGLAVDTWPPA